MKSTLYSALFLFCGLTAHAQFLTISDVSSPGIEGVSLELGDPNQPGAHPGIHLFAPQSPADTIGSILFAPLQGQPPLRLSNLTSGGGGIDIEIVSLNLTSHSPGISLRLNDPVDNIFGGTQIFRLNDSLPRLRLSNLGPAGTQGIDIELVQLDLQSIGPSIELVQDPLLSNPNQLRLLPTDTLPFISVVNRDTSSTSLVWNDLLGLPGPAITLDQFITPSETIPMVRLEPIPGTDHLIISNIGSSGCDGVSIDLGNPGLLPFFGPSLDLIRPNTLGETIPVFIFEPLITGPPLRLFHIDTTGLNGLVFETTHDFLLRTEDTSSNSSLRLDGLGTATLDANGGTLTVSNIGSSGQDGVSIDLGNKSQDSIFKIKYDANDNVVRFVNPSKYIYETDTDFTTTYVYDNLDRRILKTDHDGLNPNNDLVTEYDYDSKRSDVRGPDITNHTSSDSLESRTIYDALDRIVSEVNKPGDNDTLRSVYTFSDNSYRFLNTDTLSFSNSGSLCYGHRFFEPGKSVSVDVLNKTTSDRLTTLYDLNSRTVRLSGVSGWSHRSPGDMFCGSGYDDVNRLYTRVYADSTGTNQSMRCVYDPNAHSMSCRSVSSYTYSTANMSCRSGLTSTRYSRLYTDTSASRTMLCEYIPSLGTMSCSSYDSTSRTSSGSMRCTSSFVNSSRLFTRTYDDILDTRPALICTFDATNNSRSCDNLNFYSSRSIANILCETDASGNGGQLLINRVIDGNGAPGNGIEVISDPNTQQIIIQGLGGVTNNLFVAGNLSKGGGTFKIDHPVEPENKFLYHSFVESPDMMNVYNGNITTDQEGYAIVSLPDYFEALNIDFRYQLTVVGQFAQAIVKEKVFENKFVIQTDKPEVEVSWQVTGIRNDDYARENRVEVEVDKTSAEQGTRLYRPVGAITSSLESERSEPK